MPLKSKLFAALASLTLAGPALADDTIMIDDAYARSSGPTAKAGAAFMIIMNHGDADDRLIGVQSDVSARTELHTHKINDDGVAQMLPIEGGIAIAAGQSHEMARGGDHVMFLGLTQPFEQGDVIPVTLIFENAGEVEVEIPVDLERKAKGGHGHGHSHSD